MLIENMMNLDVYYNVSIVLCLYAINLLLDWISHKTSDSLILSRVGSTVWLKGMVWILPKTNSKSSENGWLEDYPASFLEWPIFRNYVNSHRIHVCTFTYVYHKDQPFM